MSEPIQLSMLPLAPPEPEPDVDPPAVGSRRFRVDGMDCAACARTVEEVVAGLDDVSAARVSFGNATLTIAGPVQDAVVKSAVSAAGYRIVLPDDGESASFWREPRTLSTLGAVGLLLIAVVADLAGAARVIAEPVYLLSMLMGGRPIARAAWAALRRRLLDMNVLMTLAAVGGVGIGAYAEGAWVLVLFAVGTSLEALAFDRSRSSVRALMDLAPAQARVADGGGERLVPVAEVAPGTTIMIRPGERVPLDAVVQAGASALDESPITGEAFPVDKQPGDRLFGGTLNGYGAIRARTTVWAESSTMQRIAALVEEAQGSRAPSERFVDRFARVYTPIVFVAALLLIAVPIAVGGDPDTWIYRALALLIVACPCSLVISIPVAVVSAVGRAARDGILIKGGQALEDLARVRTVALDKTGTLTRGRPELVGIRPVPGLAEDEALRLAASLERHSEHPIARAIVGAAEQRELVLDEVEGLIALPGRGVAAQVEGRDLWAGSPGLAQANGAQVSTDDAAVTTVILGERSVALATFTLADQARPEAREAVRRLPDAVMLTGDGEAAAAGVARATGVRRWRAGLLPQDKLAAVGELSKGGPVAMVGDGINDAPALAAADVGIAMGAAGSDAAIQAADVALMSDDLRRLPDAIEIGRRATRVMRQNVVASLAVKALFVALAPLGFVTLVLAVAADMGMSLLVTANGLRLLGRTRRPALEAPEGDV
jgi:Cd2+/Zn2+-exporting ATPase